MLNTSQYAKYFRVVTVLLLLATFSGCGTIKASRKILPPYGSGGGATQTTPDGMHEISGVASWYGGKFHGRQTANGERFNKNGISAAHQTLPFGTVVRVKNMRNGKTVDVRINDRGPFVKGRIIDLSKGAAEKIDMVIDGVVPVELTILHLGNG
jgi:rare lipoprotein A